MISTTVLAVIGGMAVILAAAARIPAAAAELIRACIVLVDAIKDLRAALQRPTPAASADAKAVQRDIRGLGYALGSRSVIGLRALAVRCPGTRLDLLHPARVRCARAGLPV